MVRVKQLLLSYLSHVLKKGEEGQGGGLPGVDSRDGFCGVWRA